MKTPRSDLTAQEQANVRTALKFLRARVGDWANVGKVLGFRGKSVANAGHGQSVSARLAFRVARFAGVSIDDLLAGKFPPPGTCPYCGHCPQTGEAGSQILADCEKSS